MVCVGGDIAVEFVVMFVFVGILGGPKDQILAVVKVDLDELVSNVYV